MWLEFEPSTLAVLVLISIAQASIQVRCSGQAGVNSGGNQRAQSRGQDRASHSRQLSLLEPLIEDRAKQIENWSNQNTRQAGAERTRARNLYQNIDYQSGAYQSPNYAQAPVQPYAYAPVQAGYQPIPSNYPIQQQQPQSYQPQNYADSQSSPYLLYRGGSSLEQEQIKPLTKVRVFELLKPKAKFYFTALKKNHHKGRKESLKTVVSFKDSESRLELIEPQQVIEPDFYVQEGVLPALTRAPYKKHGQEESASAEKLEEPDEGEREEPAPKVVEKEEYETVEEAPDEREEPAEEPRDNKQDKQETKLKLKQLLDALGRVSKKVAADKERVAQDDEASLQGATDVQSAGSGELALGSNEAETVLEGDSLEVNLGDKKQQAPGKPVEKQVFDAIRAGEEALAKVAEKNEKARAEGSEGALLKKEEQKALEEFEGKKASARSGAPGSDTTSVKVCASIEDC